MIGPLVRLDPATLDDVSALHALWSDPRCYQQGYLMRAPHRSEAESRELVTASLADPTRLAYTVRLVVPADPAAAPADPARPGGVVVGTSSLGDIDVAHEKVHLGWTFYGIQWWGTGINPATKLLLLRHCFDDCGFGRVRIQTDAANSRSQAAIERLGAVCEGVLRRDVRRSDGTWRDTVVYSILRTEWPTVGARLADRVTLAQRAIAAAKTSFHNPRHDA